jgi:hemoglobin
MRSRYDQIGGLPALEFAVERFSQRVATDPELAEFFAAMDSQRLRNDLVGFLVQAVSRPVRTSETMRILPRHFHRVAHHLRATLREMAMPEAVVAAVMQRVGPMSGVARPKPTRARTSMNVWADSAAVERVVRSVN